MNEAFDGSVTRAPVIRRWRKVFKWPDEVGPLQPVRLVPEVPRPRGRADAAGERPATDEVEVAGLADPAFQLDRDVDAPAVLVGDERRHRLALGVHRHPRRGHDGQRDRVDLPGRRPERGDGLPDRGQDGVAVHVDLRPDVPALVERPGRLLQDRRPREDAEMTDANRRSRPRSVDEE
jgi:hypothetical protein